MTEAPHDRASSTPPEQAAETPGEFALIARILDRLGDAAATDILVPPGDDAAVWLAANGAVVATIDALTEGNHWRADTMSFEDVGWRTVAANVSDLAAMGAQPGYLLVAACLGPTITPADLDAFIDGMAAACRAHGVRVAGGDIVRGQATMFTVAAYGSVALEDGKARTLRRGAARLGDLVAVSGHPGASAAGLAVIERGDANRPEAQPLVEAHRRPHARTAIGLDALAARISCAIDVSDGLLQDLDHIAEQSALGIEIDCAAIPLHPAAVALLGEHEALDLALGGGEDFELIVVGPDSALDALGDRVTVIGRVVPAHPGETVALDKHGTPLVPRRRGWDQLAVHDGGSTS
ncbi:MAG: thiamine-phosphate kinase [Chloroflexi bacterium]|nr:thiamine-phosphate kinase [Chloroflexota bacterium]MDA1146154.1 thiamine-phosphate kinase [Chloroflexota bacterium]